MNMWTHAICDRCWFERRAQNYGPVRMREPETETCCFCGTPTDSGIRVRCGPDETLCRGQHGTREEQKS